MSKLKKPCRHEWCPYTIVPTLSGRHIAIDHCPKCDDYRVNPYRRALHTWLARLLKEGPKIEWTTTRFSAQKNNKPKGCEL